MHKVKFQANSEVRTEESRPVLPTYKLHRHRRCEHKEVGAGAERMARLSCYARPTSAL